MVLHKRSTILHYRVQLRDIVCTVLCTRQILSLIGVLPSAGMAVVLSLLLLASFPDVYLGSLSFFLS